MALSYNDGLAVEFRSLKSNSSGDDVAVDCEMLVDGALSSLTDYGDDSQYVGGVDGVQISITNRSLIVRVDNGVSVMIRISHVSHICSFPRPDIVLQNS